MDKALLKFKGLRRVMALLGVFSLFQSVAIILQAVWLAKSITLLFHGAALADVSSSLMLFASAFAARHTFAWLAQRGIGAFSERTAKQLRMDILRRLFAQGPDAAAQVGSGKLVTLAMDGVQRIRTYLELFPPRMLDMMLITVPLLVAVYTMDFISGLILTFTLPILILFFILLGLAAQKMADKQWRSYQMLAHHFTDALRGLETLRFIGRSRSYAASIKNVSERYRKATMRTLRVAFLSSFALDFFSTLSVAFVAVGLGLRLIEGGIGLETALAVLLLAPEYFTPVRKLGSDYHASLDGKEALQQVDEMLQQRDFKENMRSEVRLPSGEIQIELKNVSVESDDGGTRCTHITTSIGPAHRKIGIVGMSGSGKTTMLNLLSGFLSPTSGDVCVQQQPLHGGVKAAWQKQLAYIPQNPYLFSETLADNVRFYEPHLSDKEVKRALDQVGLDDLVRSLPYGIHEPIGEGGRMLSGGQAHRVALARAIAGKRFVWLLDEPTAHLDIETELELKETMLGLFEQRFVVLATHRLHWMKEMDWILVMKDGQLVEAGTHEQLKAQQQYYSELLTAASWRADVDSDVDVAGQSEKEEQS